MGLKKHGSRTYKTIPPVSESVDNALWSYFKLTVILGYILTTFFTNYLGARGVFVFTEYVQELFDKSSLLSNAIVSIIIILIFGYLIVQGSKNLNKEVQTEKLTVKKVILYMMLFIFVNAVFSNLGAFVGEEQTQLEGLFWPFLGLTLDLLNFVFLVLLFVVDYSVLPWFRDDSGNNEDFTWLEWLRRAAREQNGELEVEISFRTDRLFLRFLGIRSYGHKKGPLKFSRVDGLSESLLPVHGRHVVYKATHPAFGVESFNLNDLWERPFRTGILISKM